MPVNVIGSKNFTPTQDQIQRVQDFYRWSGYKKLPDTVIFVHPKDFHEVSKEMDAPVETAITHAGRSYINARLLDTKDKTGSGNLEWTLAHEAAHLNSPGGVAFQEQHDKLYDEDADALMKQWNGPKGQGYRAIQSFLRKLPGEFEPTVSKPSDALTNFFAPSAPAAAPGATPVPTAGR